MEGISTMRLFVHHNKLSTFITYKIMVKRVGFTLLIFKASIVLILFRSLPLSAQTAPIEPELIRVLKTKSANEMLLSPDGAMYATAEAGGVVIRDTETEKEIRTIKSETRFASPIAFSPDGKRVAFGCVGSYTIAVCDLDTLAKHPRQDKFIDNEIDANAAVLKNVSWKPLPTQKIVVRNDADLNTPGATGFGAFLLSPDGGFLVTSDNVESPSNTVSYYGCDCVYIVWNTKTGKEVTRIQSGEPWADATFLPDEKELVVIQTYSRKREWSP